MKDIGKLIRLKFGIEINLSINESNFSVIKRNKQYENQKREKGE